MIKNIPLICALYKDMGIKDDYNDIWTTSNTTMTREDEYTSITELRAGVSLICRLAGNYAISSDGGIIEFDFFQVDGNNNLNVIFIRNSQGVQNLTNIHLSDVNANINEWVHFKIEFNNNTIIITANNTTLTKTLNSSDNKYTLRFTTPSLIDTLKFRNVRIY